jgi:hypothetical protein
MFEYLNEYQNHCNTLGLTNYLSNEWNYQVGR